MQRYIARRIVSALPVLLIVSMLAFGGMELVPGGPIYAYLGANPEGASLSGAQLQEIKHQYGLDQSLPVRYVRWLDRAVHWDFGASIRTKQPVTKAIGERLSVSLWLSGITFVVHIIVGLSLGVLAGIKRGSKVDFGATSLAVLGSATPSFWLAILLIVVFAVHLGWFPASGWVDPLKTPSDAFKHLVLPVLSLGVFGSATVMRQTRSAVVEVMSEDYIRTARAKGAAERLVIWRHALKNSLLPVVTVMAWLLAGLVSGSVLIERVFALPGIGRLAVDATSGDDYPVIQGIVLLSATAIIFANLLADVTYTLLDPRIRPK
jgi:peptide/nickel transport system permease protein